MATKTRSALEPRAGRVESIVKICIYEIATGAWGPGQQLPSLREARERWGANQLTVLRAYRRLVDLQLVTNLPRSGFFVTDNREVGRLARHRRELEAAYEATADRIARETGLSVVGALRYLARLAEARARAEPECAFVECTSFQAEAHAREISDRLAVPCLALTTDEIGGQPERVPAHVKTLITTSFHHHDVVEHDARPERVVLDVPIEFPPALAERLASGADRVVVLATIVENARNAARDARLRLGSSKVRFESARATVVAIEKTVTRRLASSRRTAILVSTSLWTALSTELKHSERIFPMQYRIVESAWPRIADAIGLPLGSIA